MSKLPSSLSCLHGPVASSKPSNESQKWEAAKKEKDKKWEESGPEVRRARSE